MQNQKENEQQEKQKIFPALWQEIKSAFSLKKVWGLLVFFLILLFIGGFVPVGKIPFLRNLAYAMGYTPDETQKISLLRALFSWNEHQKMLRGEIPDPDELSIFGEGGGFLASSSAKAQNKLINLRAVNSSLARKGQPAEVVKGSYYSVDTGENKKPSDFTIGNANASASTQANAVQTSEVYFGVDTSAIVRDKTDGFNSVNALQKIKNPNIAGAGPDDWMGRLVDKATRSDAGLNNIAKNIDKGGMLSKLGGVQELGQSRAHKDMYHAWLYGKTARRTSNPVLKKTLASASFDTMEMPKTVFSASGFSGVGINPDDVVADMDSVKRYLEQDKECQDAMNSVGDKVGTLKKQAREQIKQIKGSFPATCKDVQESRYSGLLSGVKALCEQVNSSYSKDLGGKCSISFNEGSCTTNKLEDRFGAFSSYCEEEDKKCEAAATPEEQAACHEEVRNKKSEEYKGGDCKDGCNADAIGQLVSETFNISTEDGKPQNPDASGFFTETNWGSLNIGDVD